MPSLGEASRPSRAKFFFFNDTATTEIYTLSLHDALPICEEGGVRRVGAIAYAERARLPPAHRIGEARIDQQIRAACGAPPRRRIQHLPQLRHLAQQRARRRAARDGLLRDQGEAELVQLDQRLERLGAQPPRRQSRALSGAPVLGLAVQQHRASPRAGRLPAAAIVTEPRAEAIRRIW